MQINKRLIASCISKDKKAQRELYGVLLPYLRAIVYRYLKDASYVKDVLQESFLKVFRSIGQYDSEKASLQQWAARITINNCINYNKRIIGIPNEELIIDQHEPIAMPTAVQEWSNENLLYVLKQMPQGYFEVFNLFIIDEYSHDEISKILGISVPLSQKRLSRARKWLKKNFQEKPEWRAKFNIHHSFKLTNMNHIEEEYNKRFNKQQLPDDGFDVEDLWNDISEDLDGKDDTKILPSNRLILLLIGVSLITALFLSLGKSEHSKNTEHQFTNSNKNVEILNERPFVSLSEQKTEQKT